MSDLPKLSLMASRVEFRELLRLHRPETAQHFVQFYKDDSVVIETVSYLAAKTLEAGDSSVLFATDAHLKTIEDRLTHSGLDLDGLRAAGRYVAVNAADTLSEILVGGWPDGAKFDRVIGGIIRRATKNSGDGFLFAFGEMVSLLCAANNPDAAVRLEQLWNYLAVQHRFSLHCAYSLSSLGAELDTLLEICAEHALAIPSEAAPVTLAAAQPLHHRTLVS